MRTPLFYIVLFVQACIIIFFIFQLERIEQVGTEIRLVTLDERELHDYDYPFIDDAYLEYEITKVPKEKWSGPLNLNYSEKVYVLLQSDKDGVYHVEEASDAKLVETNNESVVIMGQYNYYDEQSEEYQINYNFQHIKDMERFGEFTYKDDLIVTLTISKWNQFKVNDVRPKTR